MLTFTLPFFSFLISPFRAARQAFKQSRSRLTFRLYRLADVFECKNLHVKRGRDVNTHTYIESVSEIHSPLEVNGVSQVRQGSN